MKKLLFTLLTLCFASFGAMAQVKIESPHPDLDVKITRCVYASGTVIIDMVITNFGPDAKVDFTNTGSSSRGIITAYDDEGNAYSYEGNKELKIGILSLGLKEVFHVTFTFPQDIPLKFRVQLPKISEKASKLALVNLPIESSGAMSIARGKAIKIRNLEWAK